MKPVRMIRSVGRSSLVCAFALFSTMQASPALGSPVTLEFTGSIFGVSDPSDVFLTTSPNTYTLLVTWDTDPTVLPGTPLGDATIYETAPGETSISFSFLSGAGESFVSDNSFPVRIRIENTAPLNPMMPVPGTGEDQFSIQGYFAPNLKLNLVLVESHAGTNPLSSNDLPPTGFGIGPGTWFVSELDIDRTDLFANISVSVTNIEAVTPVPEPPTLSLFGLAWAVALTAPRGVRRLRSGRDIVWWGA